MMARVCTLTTMRGSRESTQEPLYLRNTAELITRLFWKDLYVVWDKMKDETDELRDSLKRYCQSSESSQRSQCPF